MWSTGQMCGFSWSGDSQNNRGRGRWAAAGQGRVACRQHTQDLSAHAGSLQCINHKVVMEISSIQGDAAWQGCWEGVVEGSRRRMRMGNNNKEE